MGALIAIFFSSVVIALSGAIMPGPLLTVTIRESARSGAIAGVKLIGGHAILELALVILLLLGIGPFLENELFFKITSIFGGCIMCWMAWGMFKNISHLSINNEKSYAHKSNLLISGILMSLANPYWIIWWASIGVGYIVHAKLYGFIGVALFYLGHISGDLLWYYAISLAVAKGKTLFNDKVYRWLIAVCASFLVSFAFFLIIIAVKKIIE